MNLLFQNIPAAKYCCETFMLEAASFPRDNKIVSQVARKGGNFRAAEIFFFLLSNSLYEYFLGLIGVHEHEFVFI